MRAALLRGREHVEIGEVDTVAEGPAAIAISIGGRRKAYAYTDPNEDAVFFGSGEGGTLLAVADGHRGFEAAEVALEHLAKHPAPQWVEPGGVRPSSWERHVLAFLCDANEQILREVRNTEKPARTTLSLALVLPELRQLLHASIGDSHVFRAGVDGAEELGAARGRPAFLGHAPETPDTLRARCEIGSVALAGTEAVVLATDGLSERQIGVADPAAAVAEAVAAARSAPPALRAREAARGLAELALAAQRGNPSGDNASVAVVWVGD